MKQIAEIEYPNVKAMMFGATQDPSNGEITVVRIPPFKGGENTFRFRNLEEMRRALLLRHAQLDVDDLVEQLENFGSAEFSAE